jgi:hypothetical protein
MDCDQTFDEKKNGRFKNHATGISTMHDVWLVATATAQDYADLMMEVDV